MADDTKKPASEKDKKQGDLKDIHALALQRYDAAWTREEENIIAAYEDLEFLTGEQWDQMVKAEREMQGRPCMTVNQLPKFIRQITGDIRQMRPAIKCVPVDDRGDPDTADVLAGMIRYIENRSKASSVYFKGADSQVQAGIGHWRVTTEYASDTTFNQEIRIARIEDGVGVLWDPDAIEQSREDAMFCFVPIDMSTAAFKAKWPDALMDDFGNQYHRSFQGWFSDESVRVCEYWYKEPIKRKLLVFETQIDDLTDTSPEDIAAAEDIVARATADGLDVRIEERDGYVVMRALMSGSEILDEPTRWPGRYIPIVPVLGEEIQIGRKRFRHGAIRFARDPQRMFNYYVSADTEVTALQPKAPFIGTDKNFEQFQDEWENANTENLPYLTYKPDPANGGVAPQRSQPPVSSQGIRQGLELAAENLKATTGIYDASLGASSNETSGKAIVARQREGDTGTYVYVENFSQAIAQTGSIVADLIPHIYDTARTVRIVGEDGEEKLVKINQPQGLFEEGGISTLQHDVTVGAYDVAMSMGPSYNTRREEAREGMQAFLQSSPEIAAGFIDLVADAQDWPNKDKIRDRAELLLPPPVRAEIAKQKGEPLPPSPEEQAQAQAAEQQQQLVAEDHQLKVADIRVKAKELQIREAELDAQLAALAMPQQPADPRVEQLAAAVQEIGQVLSAVVQALQPQPEPTLEQQMPPEMQPIMEQPPAAPIMPEELPPGM